MANRHTREFVVLKICQDRCIHHEEPLPAGGNGGPRSGEPWNGGDETQTRSTPHALGGSARSSRRLSFLAGALKDRLTAAAEQSGRSLSAEVQFRLEQSFRDEDLADRIVARLTTVLAPKPPET